MHSHLNIFVTSFLVIALGLAVPAWSAGNHAGGHSHGSDTQAGSVAFACLLPGHYDAGMKGSVAVSAAK